MRTGVFIGLAALAASPTLAAEPAQPTYVLSMKLQDGGRVVGTPRLEVRAGETAQIEIGEANGSQYSMRVILTPQAGSTVSFTSSIDLVSAARVRRSVRPALRVRLGEPAVIEFGEDSPTAKPFRVDFTVGQAADRTARPS